MSVHLAVTGATGRMGSEVLATADARDDVEVVLAVSPNGTEFEPVNELGALLDARDTHALVDFSAPKSSVEYVDTAARSGVPVIVGTTGFEDDQWDALEAASERIPVLVASNFARGIHAVLNAVTDLAENLPEYDVEITETHHNGKRDAPSGTALTIADAVENARDVTRFVHGRAGDAPREPGEVGVHARRAGDVTGEHEVVLAGNHEVVTLTHRAENRGVFAAGAVDAAVWLAERDPGWYDFGDVLEGSR